MTTTSKSMLWTGRIISGVIVLFLLFDSAIKLMDLAIVRQTLDQLGYPSSLARTIGVITLVGTLLYAFPKTSVLGAVLLTGLLGGAIATHLRVGSPLYTHTLFGVYMGVLLWLGLYLRDPGLRAIIPIRK